MLAQVAERKPEQTKLMRGALAQEVAALEFFLRRRLDQADPNDPDGAYSATSAIAGQERVQGGRLRRDAAFTRAANHRVDVEVEARRQGFVGLEANDHRWRHWERALSMLPPVEAFVIDLWLVRGGTREKTGERLGLDVRAVSRAKARGLEKMVRVMRRLNTQEERAAGTAGPS